MRLRKRLKISNTNTYIIVIVLIFFVTSILISKFNKKSKVILNNYATQEINRIFIYAIDEGIKTISNEESIIKSYIKEDNKITGIDYNYNVINKKLIDFNSIVISEFKKSENNKNSLLYNIPFGIMYKNSILSSLGPKIPVKISTIGSLNSNVETKINSYGINNVLLEVYINTESTILIILPFSSNSKNIKRKVLLSSIMLKGEIPSYYGGIITSNSQNYENK